MTDPTTPTDPAPEVPPVADPADWWAALGAPLPPGLQPDDVANLASHIRCYRADHQHLTDLGQWLRQAGAMVGWHARRLAEAEAEQ